MKSFKDATALVTGASYGIGESFARELAARGANLILVARSVDKLEALAADLRSRHCVSVHIVQTDLKLKHAPQDLFDAVSRKGLSVDLLINNAGFGRYGPFEEAGAGQDEEMLQVNVNALVALTHLFIPGMLAKGSGGVINVASTAGFQAMPFLGIYAATKAFVLSFSEALWGEYSGKGIRVLCLCPGNTKTEFHRVAGIDDARKFMAAKSGDVARYGLDIFLNTNKPTAVYGFFNRLLASGYRFFPRSWIIKITKTLYHPSQRL